MADKFQSLTNNLICQHVQNVALHAGSHVMYSFTNIILNVHEGHMEHGKIQLV